MGRRRTCHPRTFRTIPVLLILAIRQNYGFNHIILSVQVPTSAVFSKPSVELSDLTTVHGHILPNFAWDNRTCALAWEKTNLLPPAECSYPPFEGKVWNILITGTGRAGTTMIAKTLTDLGIQVPGDGAEPTIDGGIASWALAPNVQKYPKILCPPCDKPEKGRFRHIFHQVRDPLDCIPSLVTEVNYWKTHQHWLKLFVPEVDFMKIQRYNEKIHQYKDKVQQYKDKLLVALQFWVHWNSMLNYTFIPWHAVERIDIPRMLELAGYPPERIPNASTCEKVLERNKGYNAREHQQGITWRNLMSLNASLARRAMDMAKEYGYSYSDEQYGKRTKVVGSFSKSVKITGASTSNLLSS